MDGLRVFGGQFHMDSRIIRIISNLCVFDGRLHFQDSSFYKTGLDQNFRTAYRFYDSRFNDLGYVIVDDSGSILKFVEYK